VVASDTVVGIVGAVVLAGIMVGVFVYEYNNAATADGGGDGGDDRASRIQAFQAAYGHLNATEDLDGDGKANFEDDDMDGQGGPDAEQAGNLVVAFPVTGTSPAPPADTFTRTMNVTVGRGVQAVGGWVNWTSTTPAPVPASPALTCSFGDAAGADSTSCTETPPATGQAGYALRFTAPAPSPGDFVFRVGMTRPGPATSYTGVVLVDYGAPARPEQPDPDNSK
jgi:hypothetical protein